MIPSHERLDADDHPGQKIELGLVHDIELVGLDRSAQVTQHREPGRRPPIDLVAVQLHSRSLPLGVVHRDVGSSHGLQGIDVVSGDVGDPDAHGDDDLEPVEVDGPSTFAHASLGHLEDLGIVVATAEDRELVAGQPRQLVARPEQCRHSSAELHEQIVAGVMAERVVDLFEPIEIQHHHDPDTLARIGDRLRYVPLEQRARRQVGERVMSRLVLESLVQHASPQADRELMCDVGEPCHIPVVETSRCQVGL